MSSNEDYSWLSYVSLISIVIGSLLTSSGIVSMEPLFISGGIMLVSLGIVLWIELLGVKIINSLQNQSESEDDDQEEVDTEE